MRKINRIICLTICILAFVSPSAIADAEIGFWAGYGQLESNHEVELFARRNALLGRAYGQFDILHGNFITGGILVAVEQYHRWLAHTDDFGISSYTYDGYVLDLMPTVVAAFDRHRHFTLALGAGASGMLQRITIKNNGMYDFHLDNEFDDALGGAVAQSQVEFNPPEIGLAVSGRYRFLTGERSWEWPDQDDVEKVQIWTLRSELRIPLRSTRILVGFQAENQASWNPYSDTWDKWPDDWEYLGYVGLAFIIR